MRGRREAETERQEMGEMRDRDSWKEETEKRVELGGGGQTEMQIGKQRERDKQSGMRVGGRGGGQSRRLEREKGLEGVGTAPGNMQDSYDEIIKLCICHALKQVCRRDAICSGAQFVLAEAPSVNQTQLRLTLHPDGRTKSACRGGGQVGAQPHSHPWKEDTDGI